MTNPWWRVDLASCYAVTRVVVYSRVDCCSNRLTDMEIRICTILFVVGLLSGLVLFGEGLRLVVTEDSTTCVEVIFRTLNVTSKQVVAISVTINNSPSLDYSILDDQPATNISSPGFRPYTVLGTVVLLDILKYVSYSVIPLS